MALMQPSLAEPLETATHPVQAFFQRLGDAIAEAVGPTREDIYANLVRVAVEQLEAFNPSAHIRPEDLIDYVLGCRELCKQADLDAKFAEPPLSLYHGGDFDISALFWLDGTTSIHQHAFCGAFHVLAGSSIHSRYGFEPWGTPEPRQRAFGGTFRLRDLEVLHAGDTRIIERGSSLIHSLFHMVRPSVTIVVRTITDDLADNVQYDYRWPGLAHDPFQRHAPTVRKMQYLHMLRVLDAQTAGSHLRRVLADADLYLAYRLVSEQVRVSARLEDAHDLAAHCLALSADERALVAAAAQNELRSRVLVECRSKLHDPGHRFLLALLLNVFDRDELLGLVRREIGADDPVETVMTWIAEMTGRTERFPNLIGLDIGATEQRMLALMFRGQGFEAILARFTETHGAIEVARQRSALARLYTALRQSALFHHVFADLPDADLGSP